MPLVLCTVTGNISNVLGAAIPGATVTASTLAPFIYPATGQLIAGQVGSATTDGSGNFSIPIVETETAGIQMRLTLQYYDGVSTTKQKVYHVVIPNTGTATLADLLAATPQGY